MAFVFPKSLYPNQDPKNKIRFIFVFPYLDVCEYLEDGIK